MKRTLKFFAVALALMVVAASCQKEGVFNPKQKISRILTSSSYTQGTYTYNSEKTVNQIWNWDGNLLKSISFFDSDGDISFTEYYEYDGKRLKDISWGGSGHYNFVYDGNKLTTIECYSGTTLTETIEVSHNGNKISELKISDLDKKDQPAEFSASIIRFLLPNLDPKSTDKLVKIINKTKAAKSTSIYFLKFEWDGKNVSKLTYDYGTGKYVSEFEYDNMNNPFKGMYDIDEFGYIDILSQNNVVTERDIEDGEIEVNTCSYTYEGKYPVTRSVTYTDEEYTATSTTHFEYR